MKIRAIGEKLLYAAAIGVSIFLLFFVILCSWIGYEVKNKCQEAKSEYGGDCVQALTTLLHDESRGYRARNDAIWALGQLGDRRALADLQRHYTGFIPPREPLDKYISQYELKKAINLTSGGTNLIAWIWRGGFKDKKYPGSEIIQETVVVSAPSDPYYSLAQKIAQTEKLEIVAEFGDALKYNPQYVLLVAAPQNITKEKLRDIGLILQNMHEYPALGFISAGTLEKAEQLWKRASEAHAGRNYVGGDVEENQLVDAATIFDISGADVEKIPLNKDSLIEVLKKADYLYWARHVGGTSWFWNGESKTFGENDELTSNEIPPLKPVVIYTPSCNSFRPWLKKSIALGFIDQGAAAYIGNVNSPMTNAFIKRGLAVPGISSWKEFPLGLVAQVHARMMTRALFNIPQFYMLGDPRIFLSKEQPYQVISDTMDAYGNRYIEGESSVNGMLAVRIKGGSDYDFLSVTGLTSASEDDLFYNSKLQTMNLGGDKYSLFLHPGGHFRLHLSKHPPLEWVYIDALTDALDYSWVVLWLDVKIINSIFVYLIPLTLFFVVLSVKILRQKKSIRDYRMVFWMALIFSTIRLVYYFVRVEEYSVSANFANNTPIHIGLGMIGIYAGLVAGLMLMKDARNVAGRIVGLLVAVLPQFLLTGFYLAFITFMNNVTQINSMTSRDMWNYSAFWLPFIALIVEMVLLLALYQSGIMNQKAPAQEIVHTSREER